VGSTKGCRDFGPRLRFNAGGKEKGFSEMADHRRNGAAPWVVGILGIVAIVLLLVFWMPGGPTSRTAEQGSGSPGKTPANVPDTKSGPR